MYLSKIVNIDLWTIKQLTNANLETNCPFILHIQENRVCQYKKYKNHYQSNTFILKQRSKNLSQFFKITYKSK